MRLQKATQANLVLLLVSMLWGASYPVTRSCILGVSSFAFVMARFAVATLVLLPLALRAGAATPQALRLGAMLGLIEGAVCSILTWNIQFMPASRCAFIVGTSVIMVPMWSALLLDYRLRAFDLLRAATSMVGLYFLTGAQLAGIHAADLAVLLAASLWALSVVVLKAGTQRRTISPQVLAFYQALFTCLIPAALLAAVGQPLGHFGPRAVAGVLYCAICASVINLILQAKYQKYTTAAQASLRLSMEPLFACAFCVLCFDERLELGMMLGGGLMMVATWMPELCQRLLTVWRRLRPRPVAPPPAKPWPAARRLGSLPT